MARQARWDAPGTLHHVMVLGIERRRMVDDEQDRKESPAPYCWPRALSDYKNGASALTPPATSSTRHGETLTAHPFPPRHLCLHSHQHGKRSEKSRAGTPPLRRSRRHTGCRLARGWEGEREHADCSAMVCDCKA